MQMAVSCIEFNGDQVLLDDLSAISKLLDEIIAIAGLAKLKSHDHRFSPQGLSVSMILAESHIAAHTWPEKQYGYVTLTSCVSFPDDFANQVQTLINKMLNSDDVKCRML